MSSEDPYQSLPPPEERESLLEALEDLWRGRCSGCGQPLWRGTVQCSHCDGTIVDEVESWEVLLAAVDEELHQVRHELRRREKAKHRARHEEHRRRKQHHKRHL